MTTIAVVLGSLAVVSVLGGLPWLAARARRRGLAGSPLTPLDEIWHPAAHDSRIRIEVQDERVEQTPAPGDPPGVAEDRKPFRR